MILIRLPDGRLVENNPKKRKHKCGPKCRAHIKRELHKHAKEAARESISGAFAALIALSLIAAIGIKGRTSP